MKILLAFIVMSLAINVNAQAVDPRPNIVFILLDDADILDFDLYNSSTSISTPTITALANSSNSTTFYNYFSSGPNCAQTRASLLSGQYPSQLGLQRSIRRDGAIGLGNNHTGVLSQYSPRLAEELKNDGYKTASIGKWHNGLIYDFNKNGDSNSASQLNFSPVNQGFEESLVWYADCIGCDYDGDGKCYNGLGDPADNKGVQNMPDHYFSYNLYDTNNNKQCYKAYNSSDEFTVASMQNYLPNVITNEALSYITNNKNSIKPFFLNLWYFTPHGPGHEVPDCDGLTKPSDECVLLNISDDQEKYKSMVEFIDTKIAQVVNQVNQISNRETVVIITSDNGGDIAFHDTRGVDLGAGAPNPDTDPDVKYRGYKNTLYERGIKAPLIIKRYNALSSTSSKQNVDFLTSRDFFTTILDLADTPSFGDLYGISFKDEIYNQVGNQSVKDNYELRPEFWDLADTKPYRNDLSFCDGNTLINDSNNYNYTGDFLNYAVKQGDWKLIHHPPYSKSLDSQASQFCQNSRLSSTKLYKLEVGDCNSPDLSNCELIDQAQNTRFEVDSTGDPAVDLQIGADEITDRPDVVDFLTMLYDRWHFQIAPINYSTSDYCTIDPTKACQGNTNCNCGSSHPDISNYLPNLKSIDSNSQLRIHANSLSFLTTINIDPDENDQCLLNGVIAQRPYGWTFRVKSGELQFTYALQGSDGQTTDHTISTVQTGNSNSIKCGVDQHVGFSVYGGRVGDFVTRLFIDGEEVKRQTITNDGAVDIDPDRYPDYWVYDSNSSHFREHDYKIVLGSNLFAKSILRGTIDTPLISSIPFSNKEVKLLASKKTNAEAFEAGKIDYSEAIHSGVSISNNQAYYQFNNSDDNRVVILTEPVSSPPHPDDVPFNLNSDSDDFYFSTMFKLDANAYQPYTEKVVSTLATQKEYGVPFSSRFNLSLVKAAGQEDSILKLFYRYKKGDPLAPEGDTCYARIQTNGEDGYPELKVKEGEQHFVAFQKEIDDINNKVKISLYVDGKHYRTKEVAMDCSDESLLTSLPKISLGSKNVNPPGHICIQNGSNSCQPFFGEIYRPRIANIKMNDEAVYWDSRMSFLQ